jgi:sterol desaturase/sphingolipid hydroxylase (fatty acid hydroxylase superfamily)
MPSKYAVVSGVLFGVVAVIQAVRALNQWPMSVGTLEIPVWVSWVAMVVTGSLCVWAFRSARK